MSHSQFHCTGRVYLHVHGLIFETSICYWQDQPGSPGVGRGRPSAAGGGRAARRRCGQGWAPPAAVLGGSALRAAGRGARGDAWVGGGVGEGGEVRPKPPAPASPSVLDVALSRGRSAGGCLAGVPGLSEDVCARPPGPVGPAGAEGRAAGDGRSRRARLAPSPSPGSAPPPVGVSRAVLMLLRVLADSPGSRGGSAGRREARVPAAGDRGRLRPRPTEGTRRRDGGHPWEASTGGREGVEAPLAARDLRGRGLGELSPPRRGAAGYIGPGVRLCGSGTRKITSSHISAATFPGSLGPRK